MSNKQEPVAWMVKCPINNGDTGWLLGWDKSRIGTWGRLEGAENEKPLYTHPTPEAVQGLVSALELIASDRNHSKSLMSNPPIDQRAFIAEQALKAWEEANK